MGLAACFFIGHREAEKEILPYIIVTAERLIQEEHVAVFYVGGYGGFDRLAGEAIIRLKNKYSSIRLFLVIPYHPVERPIKIPPGYDGTFYPDGMESVSRKYAIAKANRKMVESCDWLIAYVTHGVSNAHNLLEYALRRQKKSLLRVVNLGDSIHPG